MKACHRFLMLLAVPLFATQSQATETIRMGYFNLAPHTYKDEATSKAKGAAVVYFEAVASKMGYQVEWVGPLPLPRLTEYLKAGESIDGTVGFPKYPAFEAFMYYPEAHVYLGQPSLMVKKDNPLTQVRSIDDIRDYRIGLVKSASGRYTPLIDDHRDMVRLEELGDDMWMEHNLAKIDHGRLEAVFDRQQYTLPYVAAKIELDTKLKVIPIQAPATPMYVVFSKGSKNGKKAFEQFKVAREQIKLNYEELLKKELDAVAHR
jgi:hypothetical protein